MRKHRKITMINNISIQICSFLTNSLDVIRNRNSSAKRIENTIKIKKTGVDNKKETYTTDINKVEIDITYECNLKCAGCNRSCTQAPTTERMEVSDIKTFIETSIVNKKQWKRISILGGEPTLHPDFREIIALIHNEYIIKYSPKTRIRLVSNRFTEKSRILCKEVKEKYNSVRVDYSSIKTDKEPDGFIPFNDAPIDDDQFPKEDYKKGCSITSVCGLGLNKRGYYACPVAAGIDRIMKKNLAISHQKEITIEKLQKQLDAFCRYCGHFKIGDNHIDRQENYKNKVSKSWKLIYKEYNREEGKPNKKCKYQ